MSRRRSTGVDLLYTRAATRFLLHNYAIYIDQSILVCVTFDTLLSNSLSLDIIYERSRLVMSPAHVRYSIFVLGYV